MEGAEKMIKVDKTKPNIIKLHKTAPELAKKFVVFNNKVEAYKEEEKRLKNLDKLLQAEKTVLFDEVNKVHKEEIKVIAPNGHIMFSVDGEEVYIVKGQECPNCGEDHTQEPAFEFLKKVLSGKIKGVAVDVQGPFPFPPPDFHPDEEDDEGGR